MYNVFADKIREPHTELEERQYSSEPLKRRGAPDEGLGPLGRRPPRPGQVCRSEQCVDGLEGDRLVAHPRGAQHYRVGRQQHLVVQLDSLHRTSHLMHRTVGSALGSGTSASVCPSQNLRTDEL